LDEFGDRLHAGVLVGGDFVRFDASFTGVKLVEQAFGAVDVRAGHVVDVDVVPGLGARLVDGEWLPVQRAVHEEIDDRPLGDALAVDLVFPIQIRLEEEVRGERVLRKCLDSAFADEFRAAVPVERVSGVVGSNRELLGVAEHGHAEREDEAGAGLPAEPRDVVRPRDVDLVGAVLVLLTVIDAADGSEMQDDVGAVEGGLQVVSVADVDVFDVDAVDAAHVAEIEVVEGDVLPVGIALGEEFDDAAADVAGRARNCDLWHVVSRGVRVCWWHGLRWISAVVGGGELVSEVANALAERVLGREPCFGEAVEVHVVGRPRMFVAEVRDFEVVVEFVLDEFGDRLDLVVLVVRADVIHVLGPRVGVERGMLVRAGGILDVDEGPPVGAVAVDGERAVRERAKHEVVDDEVEADARRVAVVRAHAERRPVEPVLAFGLPKAGFGVEFRFRVGVERVGVGGLVDVRAGRPPVEVTGRREDDVLDVEFARSS